MRRFVPSACFFLLRLLFFQAPLWGCATRHRCDEKTDKKKEEGFAFFGQRDGPSFLFSLFFFSSFFFFVCSSTLGPRIVGGRSVEFTSERERKRGRGTDKGGVRFEGESWPPKRCCCFLYICFLFWRPFFFLACYIVLVYVRFALFFKKVMRGGSGKSTGEKRQKKEKKQKGSAKKERKKGNVFVQTVEGRKKKGENANLFLFFYLLVS